MVPFGKYRGLLCTVDWVTAYVAEIRLTTFSDRGLIEQGKGSGRLQGREISDSACTHNPSLTWRDD